MKLRVTLDVHVELGAWRYEHDNASDRDAFDQICADLAKPGWYLQQEKWQQLARVERVDVRPVDRLEVAALDRKFTAADLRAALAQLQAELQDARLEQLLNQQ